MDNQRLSNLLNLTPQTPYKADAEQPWDAGSRAVEEMSDDELGEQTFQNAQEWARRGKAAQEAVNKVLSQAQMKKHDGD